MEQNEFENILKTSPETRYEYFIKTVVDRKEVWTISNNKGFATASDDNGNTLVPFWPTKEFAQYCATEEWASDTPESVDLYTFIDVWLPGMKEFGHVPSIFPADSDFALVEIDSLIADLRDELEI